MKLLEEVLQLEEVFKFEVILHVGWSSRAVPQHFFIAEPPKINSLVVTPVFSRDHTRIPLGAEVRLQCSADGHPYPIYSFHFRPWRNPSSRRELANQNFYIIPSFQGTDQGTYICLAMNEIKDRSHYDTKNVTLLLQGELFCGS